MAKWWDTQISVTRESLSMLVNRDIPLDEWMLVSSLCDTSSLGIEPGTKDFWNPIDECHGVPGVSTISPSDLQAYMIPSKKYLSKALWKKLVDSQKGSHEDFVKKYGKEYLENIMSEVLSEIDVPSHCSSSHIAYWITDEEEKELR